MLTLGGIATKNLRAHPARTIILTLLALAQAACVFGGLILMQSMRQNMVRAEQRLGADILIYPTEGINKLGDDALLMQGTPVDVRKSRSLLKKMDSCEGIDTVAYQLYLRDTTGSTPVWIAGCDPEKDFVITPWLEEGAVWREGAVAAGCKADVRDGWITLFGRSWPVFARLDETGSGMDEMVFTDMKTLRLMAETAAEAGVSKYSQVTPESTFSVALLQVQNRDSIKSITNWVNVHVRKVKAVHSEETLTDTAAGIRGQIALIAAVAGIAWTVLLLATGIALSMMMKERKKELFVWHVVGASRGIVRRVMMTEAVLIHSAGAVMGIAASAVILGPITGACLPSESPLYAALTLGLALLTGCSAMAIAVLRAAKALNGQMLLTV